MSDDEPDRSGDTTTYDLDRQGYNLVEDHAKQEYRVVDSETGDVVSTYSARDVTVGTLSDQDDVADAVAMTARQTEPAWIRDRVALRDAAERRAKQLSPVDTGRVQRAISQNDLPGDGLPGYVSCDVDTDDVRDGLYATVDGERRSVTDVQVDGTNVLARLDGGDPDESDGDQDAGADAGDDSDSDGEDTDGESLSRDRPGPVWERWDASPFDVDSLAAALSDVETVADALVRLDELPDKIRTVLVVTGGSLILLTLRDQADTPHWRVDARATRDGQDIDIVPYQLESPPDDSMADAVATLRQETALTPLGQVATRWVSDTPTVKGTPVVDAAEYRKRQAATFDDDVTDFDLFDELERGNHLFPLPEDEQQQMGQAISDAIQPLADMMKACKQNYADAFSANAAPRSLTGDDGTRVIELSNGSTLAVPAADDSRSLRVEYDHSRGNWYVEDVEDGPHGPRSVGRYPVSDSTAKRLGTGVVDPGP